jgi:ribosomal protein L28
MIASKRTREGRGKKQIAMIMTNTKTHRFFPEVPPRRMYVPIEESRKNMSLSTLCLSQTVVETS